MARLPKNLFRRGDSYYLRVKIAGRRHRVSLGPDFTEACRRLRIELARLKGGAHGHERPSADTATLAEHWWTRVAPGTQCRHAARGSRIRLQRYFLPVVRFVPLREITPEHLRDVRATAEAAGLNASTVYNVMSTTRAFLNWCTREAHLTRSPWTSGLMPKLKQSAPRKLEPVQMQAILAAARGDDRFAVEFSLLTGIRRSELVSLHRRHVQELPRPHIVLEQTKSGQVRRVPLGPRAWAVLQAQLRSHDRLFVLRHRTNNAAWTVARIGVGFHWHWHQLRHTFACRYVERGGRLAALQRILGHHSVKVTERYAQLTDESVFDDAARVEGLQAPGATRGATTDRRRRRAARQG